MSNSSSRQRNRRPRRQGRTRPSIVAEVEAAFVGAGGDGVAQHRDAPLFVPGLLPGERARVRIGAKRGRGYVGETVDLLSSSPDRVEPPCPHAGDCGGCDLQHWSDDAYVAWKDSLLDKALAAKGLTPERRLPLLKVSDGRRRL